MASGGFKIPKFKVKYIGHIAVATGKLEENLEEPLNTIRELILWLDKKYCGFKNMFIDNSGKETLNAMIYLSRKNEPVKVITNLDSKIEDGDLIIFW